MAKKYEVKLKRRQEVAESTCVFWFEKPAGFSFKAGQHIGVSLAGYLKGETADVVKLFSLASAPEEEYLMVATRVRDTAFKQTLKDLPDDAIVKIEGPYGAFFLPQKSERPVALLAGGIGVTPMRSFTVHALHAKLPHKIFLFYSNRRPEDAAFLEEFKVLETENPNFKFVATMTDMGRSERSWFSEQGYINETMLKKYLRDLVSPLYYIAGPAAMVNAMYEMLESSGVNADDIRIEEFAGY